MDDLIEFSEILKTKDELREYIGEPSALAKGKVIEHLDEHCLDFISKSPFLMLATSDNNGKTDVSPRGDKRGFVKVLNEKQLLIPERPGNKRIDSLMNLLENASISLIFVIPGLGETLRIKGTATIIKDREWMERLIENQHIPKLAIAVEVEKCFIHCAKAMIRSNIWKESTWLNKESLPKAAKILRDHAQQLNVSEARIESSLQEGYQKRLY
ncbi:pyridoxamine 5'-phosphate oxidase family protein [Alkalihalobacillus trypoxylicola]|uniref:Phosphohydrolase n=1 Tax=Alkalihalobacillus trypoxylicola TaxID=519424 RepID=A0A162CMB2_9BACI|nr:pyridoxamine 5'-phosphate oxidase family protein [Alkalihalobacillus trypoxylicola]KYG25551.1 phosphohydrolase [Alkalihalobacillus trypoxylicola]